MVFTRGTISASGALRYSILAADMKVIHWFLLFTVIGCSRPAWSLETADEALSLGERLADRYQFERALPLFMEAERKFLEAAEKTGAARARLGRIRSSVREFSLQQINVILNKELKRSPVRDDAALHLRALFLKADLGTDIDSINATAFNAAQRRNDWQEILTLSRKHANKHLENRAQGELGLLKVLDGDALGSEEVSAALWHAVEIGDVMNELRFRTAIAGLYRGAGRAHDALGHLDRAVELAESEQALSYFPAYFEKAVNLIELHRLEEALPLIAHCVGQARITRSVANNAQALYLQGKVHRQNSRLPEAVDSLKQAINLAADADYHRLVSMASLDLSQIYRSRDDLWRALDCADSGLQASLKTGDPTETIFHLQNKAAVKTEQGRFAEADRLYGEALRALNALLEKFTSAYTRAFIVSRMSGLYSDYFFLCLIKLKQPAKAFEILEQARGRSISDSIQGRRTDPSSAGEANGANRFEKYERALSRLQAQLWTKKDPQELRRIQSKIFDLEQHLGSAQLAGRHNIEAQTYLPIPLAEVQKPYTRARSFSNMSCESLSQHAWP
jgi:tetratricopeptide (TPR) repeat protein